MDSSPDLSVKLRRGSNDSRDSFYMGFAQGIDSDIEEVTTIQSALPEPLSEPEELVRLPESEVIECEEQQPLEEAVTEENVELKENPLPIEPAFDFLDQIPPPLLPEDDEDTNTSVTVIQSKNKTPSSSSSSISSAMNELVPDDAHKSQSSRVESPKSNFQSIEAEISTRSFKHSPPKRLNLSLERRAKNLDSDSVDSINEIDSKIDDDNRDDSSPTDSMPPAPTPPPLGFPLSLEKR